MPSATCCKGPASAVSGSSERAALFAARHGHLGDARDMASAFELGGEIGVEHLDGFVVGDEARREDDDVRVVVAADQRSDLGVPAETARMP